MQKKIIKISFLLLPILLVAFLSFRFKHGSTLLTTGQTSQPISASLIAVKPLQENLVEKPRTRANQKELFPVARVIDGDTIVVNIGGQPVHVRLIGINSPELNDKRPQVACFAKKAKAEAEKLLDAKNIYLEKDSTQGDYDKYGRLLAYVFLEDGMSFNKLMIEEGYAYEYTYRLPYKYQSEFKTAQQEARAARRGLWGKEICQ